MAKLHTNLINERRRRAVEALDRLLETKPGSRSLTVDELEEYYRHPYGNGWCIDMKFSDNVERTIRVLIDKNFPYSAPRIGIASGTLALDIPHREAQGILCLMPPESAVSVENSADVVEYLIEESRELIEDGILHRNQDDFRDEFLSYWENAVARESNQLNPITSIVEPKGPSRCIAAWSCNSGNHLVVGEDYESIIRWLINRGIKVGDGRFSSGLLTWLDKPLLPTEYPVTGKHLLSRIRSLETVDSKKLIRNWNPSPGTNWMLIGAASQFGVCFAGLLIEIPDISDRLSKGFRPRRVPPNILLDYYLGGAKALAKFNVRRADHGWVHGRDQDSEQAVLRRRRVAIIGCGSVGGQLARMLAQAGVGHLLLIDHDSLDWPNIARHCLGARSVGQKKAEAIAEEIRTSFPHIESVEARVEKFGLSSEALLRELAKYDLVVSVAGNWAAESFLNDWQQTTASAPPILYGWVEEHALAAHAVRIDSRGPCFRCGVNGNGEPHLRVIEWPETEGRSQEPRCGASFSPYGPCELAFAHALVAQTVIDSLVQRASGPVHRIWVADPARIIDAGGQLGDKVVKQFEAGCLKGGIFETQWPLDTVCPVCAVRTR